MLMFRVNDLLISRKKCKRLRILKRAKRSQRISDTSLSSRIQRSLLFARLTTWKTKISERMSHHLSNQRRGTAGPQLERPKLMHLMSDTTIHALSSLNQTKRQLRSRIAIFQKAPSENRREMNKRPTCVWSKSVVLTTMRSTQTPRLNTWHLSTKRIKCSKNCNSTSNCL